MVNDLVNLTIKHTPPIKLLAREYLRYLDSYENSLITHYYYQDTMMQEALAELPKDNYLMHKDITESLRARLIDWILHCCQVCEMEERNIFFLVVKLVDTFYRHQTCP